MRTIFLFLISLIFAASSELSIATYNVQNLFDGNNDGTEYRDFVIGKSQWSNRAAGGKFKRIKDEIMEINADIIALQEIENEQILKELAKASGYEYVIFSKDKKAPVGLGLMSKIKPLKSEIFRVPNVKTRDIIMAKFEFKGQEISVYAAHMPALNNSAKKRQTAFTTLKNAVNTSKNVILLGDFNTHYGKGSMLNDIAASRNLVNLWQFVPKDERYSHANLKAIDHVLLSSDMLDGGEILYKTDSFKIHGQGDTAASDHFALKFRLVTAKDAKKLREFSIDDAFNNPKSTPFILKGVSVIYADKKGFIIAKNGRGIYVYDPDTSYELGSVMDAVVTRMNKFKGASEITAMRAAKIYDEKADIKAQMLPENRLKEARVGDVMRSVSGEIKNGKIYTKYGDMRIYSDSGRLKNAKSAKFEAVRVVSYKNEPQLWIEK